MDDLIKQIEKWIAEETAAGRPVDLNSIDKKMQSLALKQHSTHKSDEDDHLLGLSEDDITTLILAPFGGFSVVKINTLTKEQYLQFPFIRQILFLLQTLEAQEIKLTKNGWLPLKVVAEAYKLGMPDYFIEEFGKKRINEHDALSVELARGYIEVLRLTKVRKGVLSLTAKGKKALQNVDDFVNDLFYDIFTTGILHYLDLHDDPRPGNDGMALTIWMLHKYGSEWRSGQFYKIHYQRFLNYPDKYNIYATRTLKRLFYFLGIVEHRKVRNPAIIFDYEYKTTPLFPILFSFTD